MLGTHMKNCALDSGLKEEDHTAEDAQLHRVERAMEIESDTKICTEIYCFAL